jgi:hypothetical protein
MDNPFKKRATEYIADAQGLLSLLSAEPVRLFLDNDQEEQFDRLVIVVGTPGSGKTTIAKLFEFDTLVALARSLQTTSLRQLGSLLHERRILIEGAPRLLAYRFPATSSLRDVWELPYQETVRHSLLRSFIQTRTALGWMRKLERAGVDISGVELVAKEDAEAQARRLKLYDPLEFREHARILEEQIFKIITALVPPKEEELIGLPISVKYELFEAVQSIRVPPIPGVSERPVDIRPMLMLDDAHELHPKQLVDLDSWLRDREMKIARWVLTRVDAVSHADFRNALAEASSEPQSGTTPGRDRIIKLMQKERARKPFRGVARDVSRKYLAQMPMFSRRGLDTLERCLREEAPAISPSQQKQLESEILSLERSSKLGPAKLKALRASVPERLKPDVAAAVYRILVTRELKRVPQHDMFGADEELQTTGEPTGEAKRAGVVAGAEVQLLHQFGRPFYYGFDRVADCSNANIEQFIGLAGTLVEMIEAKIVRGKEPLLDPREQHNALMKRAQETMRNWNFPHTESVKKLVGFIAERCVARTLEANAPLDEGANAFGVPQSEMDRLGETAPDLAAVVHYALAYNALSLRENYECKKREWCLFELGGVPLIANMLPLAKGGFCEGRIADLSGAIAA